jgi:predicted enzyme related to lactoylglutathione lyase
MLKIKDVGAALPAQDIARARQFYEQKLGLKPSELQPDGSARYQVGNSTFFVFVSRGKASGDHTQMGFEVDDASSAVGELKKAGIMVEEYDYPDFKTKDGVVEMPDGGKGAWFKDTEGNLISILQRAPVAAASTTSGGATTSR